jgi:hypothetical protein
VRSAAEHPEIRKRIRINRVNRKGPEVYAPGTAVPSADTSGDPMPVTRDEERPLSDARRNISGRSEG